MVTTEQREVSWTTYPPASLLLDIRTFPAAPDGTPPYPTRRPRGARPATGRRDTRYPPRSAGIFLCPPALSAPTGRNPRPRPRPRTPSNGGSTGERRRVRYREDPERPDARRTRDRPTAAAVPGVGARTIRRRDIRAGTDRLPRSDGRAVPGPAAPLPELPVRRLHAGGVLALLHTGRAIEGAGAAGTGMRRRQPPGERPHRTARRPVDGAALGLRHRATRRPGGPVPAPDPRAPWRCGSRWSCAPAASPR